jgi:hypothetical protein
MSGMTEPPFVQSDAVRDFVFPIAEMTAEWAFVSYVGTGFFIGKRGYALTAAHVARALRPEFAKCGIFVDRHDNDWRAFSFAEVECHPHEDVALVRLEHGSWDSPFRLAGTWQGASRDYHLFGYPGDAVIDSSDPSRAPAPDLVYMKGYFRRRISRPISGLIGSSFFELSQPAYGGCSGAPLWFHDRRSHAWLLGGIYVGYLIAKDPKVPFTSIGYAVREDSFRGWIPRLLGRSILEEAADSSLGIRP